MAEPIAIKTMDELRDCLGKEVAVGRWRHITQELINQYAEAVDDHNWLHVDVERCRRESPHKTTIAHGNLIYGLLCAIRRNVDIELPPAKSMLTYGTNKIRFSGVVPAGSRVRGRYKPIEIQDVDDKKRKIIWEVTGELEGSPKPVLITHWIAWHVSP